MITFPGECGDPPALHLEPGLVRNGLAAHARRLCPGPDLLGHLAPGGRGATDPRHHHHRHLCRVLRHDGSGGWRSWSPPHACAQPGLQSISFHQFPSFPSVDIQVGGSGSPCGRIASLASSSCLPCCRLDCTGSTFFFSFYSFAFGCPIKNAYIISTSSSLVTASLKGGHLHFLTPGTRSHVLVISNYKSVT